VKAQEVHEATRADDLLAKVNHPSERAERLLDKAEAAEKWGPAASAIREATRLVELLARLRGELVSGATTNVTTINVTAHPDWRAIRDLIFKTLGPHPELQAQFREGLRALPSSSADSRESL
jgi:hypothetical protein